MSVHWGGKGPAHLSRLTTAATSNPLAAYALADDFKTPRYFVGGTQYTPLSSVPGYSYTRSGTVSYVNASGGIETFAANVPPVVTGKGYMSYGALTNLNLQSQSFDDAAWTPSGTTVVANNVTAPDGTLSADTLTATTTSGQIGVASSVTVTSGATYTTSFFVPAGGSSAFTYCQINVGGGGATGAAFVTFDRSTGAVSASQTLVAGISITGYTVPVSGGWRAVAIYTIPVGTTVLQPYIGLSDATASRATTIGKTMPIWQMQTLAGSFPDGGPIIVTTSATASIGASTLSETLANGTYSAKYTFSDNTTQTISTTVSGTTFTMPAYPATLNGPAVSLVTLS